MAISDSRDLLAELRRRRPLVHCLTNFVAMELTANVLLAAGASPAMVVAEEEAAEFAAVADALLVNVGTLTVDGASAIRAAVASARDAGTPWVLDPVAVGPLSFRTELCVELLAERPAIVRGNASEIMALAGRSGGGKGVDATTGAAEAVPAARELASRSGAVVAVSGEADHVTDGERVETVPGGDALLTLVTGAGCALGALMAGLAATAEQPFDAATAASAAFALAAERAAGHAAGPGSFATRLLDELAALGR